LDAIDRPEGKVIPQKLPAMVHVIETWGKAMSEYEDLKVFF
jgi:hypothetical protein